MLLLRLRGQKVVRVDEPFSLLKLATSLIIETSERAKVRKAMEAMLFKAAMKIVTTVNREKDHIPPITTSESNPFPYQIVINPRDNGWGARILGFGER